MNNKDWEKELEEIKDELLDMVNEYFPKIKPEGINEGRGEAAVIVGLALSRFQGLLKYKLATQKKEMAPYDIRKYKGWDKDAIYADVTEVVKQLEKVGE